MTGAWVAIALILIGLPLLGWFVSRRAMWNRLRARSAPDAYGDTVRRHRLSAGEVQRVQQALLRGEELEDPRLRAAVVDWGAQLTRGGPPLQTWLLVGLAVWGAAVLANVVFAVAEGRWGDVNWFSAATWLLLGVLGHRRRERVRRAVRVNGGPPGGAPEDSVHRPELR